LNHAVLFNDAVLCVNCFGGCWH